MRKKMRVVMMTGLVVGAYFAGYNDITHVEVMEYVETAMNNTEAFINYIDRMIDYIKENDLVTS